ncbi:MAG: DEAD/DEAH box helicase family protein [Candidatus Absconditabacterales bacterium]
MMPKQLKNYQDKAVAKLTLRTKELFEEKLEKRTIIFQSPTGSGKTFIMSQYIKQIIEELKEHDLCFLWISIGKGDLHRQSYDTLKKEFEGFPECHILEEEFFGSRKTIVSNEVVIVNREKLRAKDSQTGVRKNILMKDKETTNFIELIQNTKEEGRTIIMIIDESHSNSTSERAIELRDKVVNADLTIEMSATPVFKEGQYNEKVLVQSTDVIEEGMIKKEIIINENIDKISTNEITSQELILESAYQKRLELQKQYKEAGIDVNPLVLIQLPISEAGEDKKEFIEDFLNKKGITYDNKKLAVRLSEEKVNHEKDFVTPNQSGVDFLIFKQAIDTGRDCPRAQILVRFREIRSITFEIQTVGRILRMPEAKHYDNDNLNRAFVYLNTNEFDVNQETYNPNIIKSINVKRKAIYSPLKLASYYRNRVDQGDVRADFYDSLENILCGYFGIEKGKLVAGIYEKNKKKIGEKIDIKGLDNKDEIILNKEIDVSFFDQMPQEKIETNQNIRANLSQNDLQFAFENLIRINLQGFAPKRSIPIIKKALYDRFGEYMSLNLAGNGAIYIQNVVLNNVEIFSQLLNQSVETYKPEKEKELLKQMKESEKRDDKREIAQNRNFNPNTYKKYNYKKSLYEPVYLRLDSEIEKYFIEYLDNNKKVVRWRQNGDEHMETNFGIKYDGYLTFQPDFLVLFNDGKIGIFDTKAIGDREEKNKIKSEALQEYIVEQNKKGKKLFGGIVVKDGEHFRINQKEKYVSFKEKADDWEYFTI